MKQEGVTYYLILLCSKFSSGSAYVSERRGLKPLTKKSDKIFFHYPRVTLPPLASFLTLNMQKFGRGLSYFGINICMLCGKEKQLLYTMREKTYGIYISLD